MSRWKSFGASVCGPAHLELGLPNQDAWESEHYPWGDCVSVSDGVGSKAHAEIGSEAACWSVSRVFRGGYGIMSAAEDFLFKEICEKWLSRIGTHDADECAATCLFAIRSSVGLIHLGVLGDGLVAVLKTDGAMLCIADSKSDSFSNVTLALSPKTSQADWRHLMLPEDDCEAILLCTDGIADDLEDREGFVRGFIEAHRSLDRESANRQIQEMLKNWPTPGHSDDKTIVCLCREVVADE